MELVSILSLLMLNLILIAAVLLFIIWLWQSMFFQAPFLPLPMAVTQRVALLSKLPTAGRFYDLGSGDGRVVRAVAKQHPSTLCFGVEKALLPNLLTWFYSLSPSLKNVKYLKEDFTTVSLSHADAVFLYLWPGIMDQVANKLKAELPKNAQVISCNFELPEFSLEQTEIVCIKNRRYKLYLYSVGL